MFGQLFEILDIPLVCVFTILTMFGVLILRNIYNIFLSLFISIFLLIFLSSTILTQQIYLGEFLIISTFFILIMVFFIFNLNNNFDDSNIVHDDKKFDIRSIFIVLSLIFVFSLILGNFNNIVKNNTNFITQTTAEVNSIKPMDKQTQIVYNDYLERISLLNQNKVFQKLTHLVMFYTCAVIVLYFFNKKGDNNEG